MKNEINAADRREKMGKIIKRPMMEAGEIARSIVIKLWLFFVR